MNTPLTKPTGKRYALITPVRDEEKYIEAMIESIAGQDIQPDKWVIVDDGSLDRTPEIVETNASRLPFIELVRLPKRQERAPGGEAAIIHALRRINLADYDFLARFDADLLFENDYIRRIFEEFDRDPELGIAGGGLFVSRDGRLDLEVVPDYHVRGALKMYRRQCFEEIGGITTRIGWDTIDEVYAWTKGWRTKSFFGLRVIHRRPTGEGILSRRIYWERGKAEYYTWSLPLFVFAKALYMVRHLNSVAKPSYFLAGFICSHFGAGKRFHDPVFIRTRRAQQRTRLASFLGAEQTS